MQAKQISAELLAAAIVRVSASIISFDFLSGSIPPATAVTALTNAPADKLIELRAQDAFMRMHKRSEPSGRQLC